ncbi:CDP-diacylglycerol--glycerol-3-phosphate 3-phosphatidyltransferase [Congzhengia sp.]|uniref:CDP-diacylglycerol--glycerol-3-phosphate 3-phosphatidyltransferase n=1 Tax=Congzhengia sp. TaxID=2944168 RepID=UPI000E7DBEE8|nr:CDP-diacylglycerol--glycerol-3-phosphate 3-phosphatidyltransferase [Clostridiales bacterium]HBL83263.1 CDP-diacylglycerol--glycerol-3-phosphate 3-phosphatidyltransferase [Clostridiales bacterium]
MNIPNMLSILRLVMVPVFILVFLIEGEQKTAAAAIFILASATDVLDGYIARKYNMTTKIGQLLDPLADKLMQIAVVVTMLCAKMVPLWFVLVLASKELLMIVGGAFLFAKKTFVKSNVFGKLNTVAMFCAMVILLIFSVTNVTLKNVMLGVVVVTNAAAIVSYLYLYFIKQKQFKNYIGKKQDGGLNS